MAAGWLALYAMDSDVALLRERLNADPEIAFIVPVGPGRWQAVRQSEDPAGKTVLWHVPGGALPLMGAEEGSFIEDPWSGWRELESGLDRSLPYFGPAWPSVLLLELYPPGWRGLLRVDCIPLSGLSMPGVRGTRPVASSTRQWWRRFGDWVRRRAVRITRSGPLDGPHADVWAMPAALSAIRSGVERDEWPLVR
jgi:hypothetical protein